MPCADSANKNILADRGVGFGVGGFIVMCLALLLVPPPRRRKASPRGGHPAQECGPGQEDSDIGPERLRQLLERNPVTGAQPPVPRVAPAPGCDVALAPGLEATPR